MDSTSVLEVILERDWMTRPGVEATTSQRQMRGASKVETWPGGIDCGADKPEWASARSLTTLPLEVSGLQWHFSM